MKRTEINRIGQLQTKVLELTRERNESRADAATLRGDKRAQQTTIGRLIREQNEMLATIGDLRQNQKDAGSTIMDLRANLSTATGALGRATAHIETCDLPEYVEAALDLR